MQLPERDLDETRVRVQPVLEQPDQAPGEGLGVDRAGRGHHAFDVGGQLCLGPQHAVDAEFFKPLKLFGIGKEIRARDDANGFGARQAIGDRAGHDVDFIERRRRHEEPRVLDAGALEHLFAGAAADDEFGVDGGKGVGDRAIVIDDDHLVVRRQCPRQGRADLPAANDYDAHRGIVRINVADPGAEPRLSR